LPLLAAANLARAERVEAWGAGEVVFVDGAPDGGRHCGELVVGEINCWHRQVRSVFEDQVGGVALQACRS
jgi:hypothetical protein